MAAGTHFAKQLTCIVVQMQAPLRTQQTVCEGDLPSQNTFCEGSCLHKMDSVNGAVKGAAFTKWIL